MSTEAGEASSAAEPDAADAGTGLVLDEAGATADAADSGAPATPPTLCCELPATCQHGGPLEGARCVAPSGWATWRTGPNGSAVGGNCLTTAAEVGDTCAWVAGSAASFTNCGAAGTVVRCGP